MKIELTYFDGAGRAEPIRLAFHLGGVEFTDCRIQVADWASFRESADAAPLGQLPVLRVDGTAYTQSAAMLRFAGKLSNLYPADALAQLQADEVVEVALEVMNKAPQSADPARKQALREEYSGGHMAKLFGLLERRIAQHGEESWSAGSKLSIADIAVHNVTALVVEGQFDYVPASYCNQFPRVLALYKRFRELPRVREYYSPPPATSPGPIPGQSAAKGLDVPTIGAVAPDVPVPVPAAPVASEPSALVVPPKLVCIWDDDVALGKVAPSMDSLEYLQGDQVHFGQGKITVLAFWANFAEGDYVTLLALAEIHRANPGLQIVGVSCDTTMEQAQAFVSKLGKPFPNLNIPLLSVGFPLAFDPNRECRLAMQTTTGVASIGPSAIFVVDGDGKIAWREQFSQMYPLENGQLREQIRRLIVGEPLLKNGDAPIEDDGGDDDFDSNNGTDVDSEDSDGLLF